MNTLMPQYRLEVQRTTLWTVLLSVALLAAGVLLLFISALDFWATNAGAHAVQQVVRSIGALLVASVAIFLIWQLAAKRVFLDEILSKVGISSGLRTTGLLHVPFDSADVSWSDLFAHARSVDLFFIYAKSWRGLHEIKLRQLSENPDVCIRVVLPNPKNESLMKQLGDATGKTHSEICERINAAIKDFISLQGNAADIQVYLTDMHPQLAYYRFDEHVVFSLYSLSKQKCPVPHFVVARGGDLYAFLTRQFGDLLQNSKEIKAGSAD